MSLAELRDYVEPPIDCEFDVEWIEKGWNREKSDVICRVLNNEGGDLSGTVKLVSYASGRRVAEVYFPHVGLPRVVVAYTRKADGA